MSSRGSEPCSRVQDLRLLNLGFWVLGFGFWVQRKRGVGVLSTGEEQKVLWRVNPEEFLRSFRHEVCVTMIADRSDRSAADVARGLLAFSRPQEQSLRQKESGAATLPPFNQRGSG